MKRLFLLAPLLSLTACPPTGVVCQSGTARCGEGCADFHFDARNCGACGNACATGQSCIDSVCVCSAGTSQCGSLCAVLQTDPNNCGACGNVCPSGQVCESADGGVGACRASCSLGTHLDCGGACVDPGSDPNHCGACDTACAATQSCHLGHCTWDLVAACFNGGQVVGLQLSSEQRGPTASLGTGPAALASYGQTLLSADGIDARLYQARLADLSPWAKLNATGQAPNQVLVDSPYVYVVNASDDTLQVLQLGVADDAGLTPLPGALTDGGLELATVGELSFGDNTYPEAVAKAGGALWVPLYGGFGATNAAAGQKVAKVDVSNPALPTVTGTVDLSSLDLHAFDGGTPVARPFAIAAHQGQLYVALNNLDPDTYVPEGPGMLAKIDPASSALSSIDLGASRCLNPVWLASDGTHLFVSCAGAAVYSGPPDYALVSSDAAGVVMLDATDAVVASWSAQCPAGSDGGCAPILPSRLAVASGRVYVGDGNGGRVFVLEVGANSLTERRGYAGDAGLPLQLCTPDSVTGIANVSDLLVVP